MKVKEAKLHVESEHCAGRLAWEMSEIDGKVLITNMVFRNESENSNITCQNMLWERYMLFVCLIAMLPIKGWCGVWESESEHENESKSALTHHKQNADLRDDERDMKVKVGKANNWSGVVGMMSQNGKWKEHEVVQKKT